MTGKQETVNARLEPCLSSGGNTMGAKGKCQAVMSNMISDQNDGEFWKEIKDRKRSVLVPRTGISTRTKYVEIRTVHHECMFLEINEKPTYFLTHSGKRMDYL